jgi:hypothetical protein
VLVTSHFWKTTLLFAYVLLIVTWDKAWLRFVPGLEDSVQICSTITWAFPHFLKIIVPYDLRIILLGLMQVETVQLRKEDMQNGIDSAAFCSLNYLADSSSEALRDASTMTSVFAPCQMSGTVDRFILPYLS